MKKSKLLKYEASVNFCIIIWSKSRAEWCASHIQCMRPEMSRQGGMTQGSRKIDLVCQSHSLLIVVIDSCLQTDAHQSSHI